MARLSSRLAGEFIGTFWLVFGGCGSAVLAAAYPNLGIGFAGVALAFGLTLVSGIYAFGHVSGGHFNPAVTVGLMTAGRFAGKDALPYIAVQLGGAALGAAILYVIASGQPGFSAGGFAANGYGTHSPGGYSLMACFIAEFVLSFMFLLIILGATSDAAPKGFAPIAIGLGLTLIHLDGIPVTNTSVNPARSFGPALFAEAWALGQLWLFVAAPLLGAVAAAWCYRSVMETAPSERPALRPTARAART